MRVRVTRAARLLTIAGIVCAAMGTTALGQDGTQNDATTPVKVAQSTVTKNRPPVTAKKPAAEKTSTPSAPTFEFSGSVHVAESYVDNASGLAGGSKSDFISSLGLSAHVQDLTSRARLVADYTFNTDFYARGTQRTQFANSLLALGDVEVIPEYLSIGARAFATPVVSSNVGIITAGNRPVANGFHSSYGFLVEPVLKFRIGHFADSQTIPLYGATYFTSAAGSAPVPIIPGLSGPEDTTTRGITQRFTGGEDFNRLTWNAIGAFVETKRRQELLSDKEGSSTLKYAISHEFALLATGGYASINDTKPLARNVSGLIAMGGFALTLGPDFDLEVEAGEKFRDFSFLGSLRYNLNPTASIVGSANDVITTPEGQLLDNLNNLIATPNGELTSNDNLLASGAPALLSSFDFLSLGNLSFDQNISRNQTLSLAWLEDFERNHLDVAFFGIRRTFLSGVLIGPPRTISWGGSATLSRDLTPVLIGTLRGNYSVTQELGGTARTISTGVELRYLMAREMELSFRGDYLDRHSSEVLRNLSPFTGNLSDYRLTLYLTRRF